MLGFVAAEVSGARREEGSGAENSGFEFRVFGFRRLGVLGFGLMALIRGSQNWGGGGGGGYGHSTMAHRAPHSRDWHCARCRRYFGKLPYKVLRLHVW